MNRDLLGLIENLANHREKRLRSRHYERKSVAADSSVVRDPRQYVRQVRSRSQEIRLAVFRVVQQSKETGQIGIRIIPDSRRRGTMNGTTAFVVFGDTRRDRIQLRRNALPRSRAIGAFSACRRGSESLHRAGTAFHRESR